jgi:uncharacterized phiE125 gp8 family phage protein
MQYNVSQGTVKEVIEPVEEPVTLDEVKEHLRIDFEDDDDYLDRLISSVRAEVETSTGLSLIARTITTTVGNVNANYSLPYGPVTGAITVKDSDGVNVNTDFYAFTDDLFPSLTTSQTQSYFYPITGGVIIEPTYRTFPKWTFSYTAGYTRDTIPEDLKQGIIEKIAFRYEHRGDENIKEVESQAVKNHKRGSWLL